MINMFFYFFFMFYMFLLCFMISLGLYYLNLSILFEWLIFSSNSLNMEMMVLIDWISLLFLSVIFLISSMIMLYSYEYMSGNNYIERFVYLVLLFVMSMMLMILSPNIISILFGWDGLGLTSYCLVIFYQNYMSYNSGMVTVLCNRIGDVGLLLGVGVMAVLGGWNHWNLKYLGLGGFMLMLAAITKSAQMPFSVWLPMAMAAPTPVSALVHSSTLVTAGVYLMIRFNNFLLGCKLSGVLFFISVLTMFMAGLMANVENDLKKIIALSTLSQLGLMMMILSIGQELIAFYHLLTHAIFKSLMFMCAGVIIHLMSNSQDIRTMGGLNNFIPFTMISFYMSSLALCGFPFLAGFYSKDYIMEIMYNDQVNGFMQILVVMSLMLTVSYSIRLFYYLFFNDMKFLSSYMNMKEIPLMSFSMVILMLFSVLVGSLLNWLFFFDYYFIYLNFKIKLITLLMCFLGGLLSSIFILNMMVKFYNFLFFLSSMWYLNYLYMWVYSPLNNLGEVMEELDRTWIEYIFGSVFNYLNNNFFYLVNDYNIYMFMAFMTFISVSLFMLI
uniref:NADH-ubiquinone oxidoreductase chain 5 n=1 Tax=Meranoplus bicolor TaxID=611886 RepID=A0A8K1VER0_9HYME|nr:NADH dehydrogenase subunit 5 [Meranoplus bicolor]